MTAKRKQQLPTGPMTVDEYLVWADSHPGKFELHDGVIIAMAAERVGHAVMKFEVQTELERAIKKAKLDCTMMPDGMTVRIAEKTAYEPDALVYCGPNVPPKDVEIPHPVIVVEVLSVSTRTYDSNDKLDGYLRVPSIRHYMVFSPDHSRLTVHSKQADGMILTQIATKGILRLDPPGIDFNLDNVFSAS